VTRASRASALPVSALVALFNRGYEGYFVPLTLDQAAFDDMVAMQDVDLDASRVLEWEGAPAAFAMLAVRESRGWIGGMGVIPEARGRGFGRVAMEAALESARARGLRQVDLEVLVQNEPAIRIYEQLGFRDVRELGVWVRPPRDDSAPGAPPAEAASAGVTDLDVGDCIARYGAMQRAQAPWQRDEPVVKRVRERIQALGIREGAEPAAWILFRALEGQARLMDVALAPGAPIARLDACLARLVRDHDRSTITYLNLPIDAIEAEAFTRAGFTPRWRQREMRLVL
jgi:ribosomal protein S18 acetylase RimI-like enzyme